MSIAEQNPKDKTTLGQLEKVIENVANWKDNLALSKRGTLKQSRRNLQQAIRHHPEIGPTVGHNLLDGTTWVLNAAPWAMDFKKWRGPRPLTNNDLSGLFGFLISDEIGLYSATEGAIASVLNAVALENRFHSFQQYLEELPAWDGVKRLEGVFPKFCGADDTPLNRWAGKALFLSMVVRAYVPACKYDCVIILQGSQGPGKTSFFEAVGGEYFSEALGRIDSKDFWQALHGKMLVELGECERFLTGKDSDAKGLISRRVDRYRPPYARLVEDIPRTAILCGTTNHDDFLTDATGNRRYLPISVKLCDYKRMMRERDLLFSEATAMWADASNPINIEGVSFEKKWKDQEQVARDILSMPQGLWADASEQQAQRMEADPLEEKVDAFLKGRPNTTTAMIMESLGIEAHQQTKALGVRIGKILKIRGWERRQVRREGKRGWWYFDPEQEENLNQVPF